MMIMLLLCIINNSHIYYNNILISMLDLGHEYSYNA